MDNLEYYDIILQKYALEGVNSLSDSELLSVIINKGNPSKSSFDRAKTFVELLGDIKNLTPSLIDNSRAISARDKRYFNSLIEFCNRLDYRKQSNVTSITTIKDITDIFYQKIGYLPYEELWLIALSSSNKIIELVQISSGTETSAIADLKVILKRVINLLATNVILVHNHPNGIIEPSGEDISLTKKLSEALKQIDIILLDHVIVYQDKHYSMVENGKY